MAQYPCHQAADVEGHRWCAGWKAPSGRDCGLTAISAVSKARISPTRMMLGSWRKKARRAAAKFKRSALFHRTGDSTQLEFDGVFRGYDVGATVFRRDTDEYR